MNDADLILGRKKKVDMPSAKRSHFGRYPVRIRSVCDAFMDEMGWNADPTTIRDVAAGGKRFVDVCGENPDLVRKTIRHLKHNAPHIYRKIGSPGSLYKTARGLGASVDADSEAYRRRYTAWEDE